MIIVGRTRTIRLTVPDDATTLQLPDDVGWFFCQNVGANDCKLQFEEDGVDDYFLLKPNTKTNTINTIGGKVLELDGVGGATVVEFILWG